MKPPIPYFASKSKIAPWIVSMLPPHEHCAALALLPTEADA